MINIIDNDGSRVDKTYIPVVGNIINRWYVCLSIVDVIIILNIAMLYQLLIIITHIRAHARIHACACNICKEDGSHCGSVLEIRQRKWEDCHPHPPPPPPPLHILLFFFLFYNFSFLFTFFTFFGFFAMFMF